MKKFFLFLVLGFIMTINFNANSQDLAIEDRYKIIDNMNKYAIGIDTKDYTLFRSIFSDDVVVKVVYDPNWRGGGEVKFEGLNNWVDYVETAISQYRNTQHMLGNPMIVFDGNIAIVRTDLQATHYYKDKPDTSTTLWGYYETHMVKENNWKIIKHTLTSYGSD